MVVASDAMAGFGVDGKLLPWDADYTEYAGHPRTAGTRGKTLRLGREQGVPLMFTLAQLSYWTALPLGDAGLGIHAGPRTCAGGQDRGSDPVRP